MGGENDPLNEIVINENEMNWPDNPTELLTDHLSQTQLSNENQMDSIFDFDPADAFSDIFTLHGPNLETANPLVTGDDVDIFSDSDPNTNFSFILSEEAHPTLNAEVPQVVNVVPNDTQLDQEEWQVRDERSQRLRSPKLLEFLVLCLKKPHYQSYVTFIDRSQGIFQVHEPDRMAELWGKVRNRQSQLKMTYDKLARGIRWYYPAGLMIKTNTRYTFQFSRRTMEAFSIDEINDLFALDFLDD